MAWNDDPPTKQELSSNSNDWTKQPPSADELNQFTEQDIPKEDWSQLQSAGQGALQGSTLGFSDELGGLLGAGMEKGADLIGKGPNTGQSLQELYQQYRDLHRERNKSAEEANPISYLGGNIAGGLPVIPESAASVGGGALLGATAGLGASEAQDLKGATIDTALGAGIGGATGFIGNQISKMLNPEKLEAGASKLASKAGGVKPSKELARVYNKATGEVEEGSNIVRGIGKTAMEENALPITGGTDAMYDKTLEAIDRNYDKLNPIIPRVQQKLDQDLSKYIEAAGSLKDKAYNFINEFADNLSKNPDRDAILQKIQQKYMPYIDDIMKSDGNLEQLTQFKKAVYDYATDLSSAAYEQPSSNLKPEAEFVTRFGGVLKQHIEDLASSADQQAGKQIGEINKTLSNLYTYKDGVKKLMNKGSSLSASRLLGLPVEAVTGHSVDRFGKIALAKTMNATSKGIQTPAGQLVQKTVTNAPSALLLNPFSQESAQRIGKQLTSGTEEAEIPQQGNAKITTTASNLYNATDDSLKEVASNLKKTPGLQYYGDHLDKAISSNDAGEKNRAIFLILQNPQSRQLVSPKDELEK